ncbi:MAG: protoheme IX farnesyltransferase [Candidatus Sumerlaea sp.]|uniref:Protoheme IX farnesyltransferase n=1 Tax=Sumerlaea chitinivorans TaxID=2250252 RepID=A0A2Z4Y7U5_SUMC1|nr:Heme O synthase, protoheme IX farnesyltransferase [Candidatus Sumerlaea chitinivorans]GIX43822.1 MAG: protoheme IX farnesyltransferase [Candidatus Sumerlaea sp.]
MSTYALDSHAKAEAPPVAAAPSWLADLTELFKLRIVAFTAFTAATGFAVASPAEVDYSGLFWAVLACVLAAGGSSALNQYLERDTDALMERTRHRPLPAGRIAPRGALFLGFQLVVAGVTLLALTTNLLAAALLLATVVLYVWVYTPLKRRTALCTIVGAVPGAMPPLVGWAAATGKIEFGGIVLFAIMFLWQLPHFIAIGWVYREDYLRGGLRMLTHLDADGILAARQAFLYSAALFVVGAMPCVAHLAGMTYLLGSFLLGGAFLVLNLRWNLQPSRKHAYGVFFGSLAYLILLFSLLLADRVGA